MAVNDMAALSVKAKLLKNAQNRPLGLFGVITFDKCVVSILFSS